MLYVLRLTIILLLVVSPALAADELSDTIQAVMKHAKKDAAQMKIPVNAYLDEGMQAAQESAKLFHSPEFQAKLKCEQQRLKKDVFTGFIQEPVEKEISAPGQLAENEKVYLFISSSIPDVTVHTYFTALDGVKATGITLVMKGFVPGKRSKYLARITQKDLNCVAQLQSKAPVTCERFKIPIKIKPSLFDRFAITQVPAVVYEREGAAWKITGDMALDYLLEKINYQASSYGLKRLITTLRGS